jgi:hypothetical protein
MICNRDLADARHQPLGDCEHGESGQVLHASDRFGHAGRISAMAEADIPVGDDGRKSLNASWRAITVGDLKPPEKLRIRLMHTTGSPPLKRIAGERRRHGNRAQVAP